MKIDTSAHVLPLVLTTELTEAEHRFEILKSENMLSMYIVHTYIEQKKRQEY